VRLPSPLLIGLVCIAAIARGQETGEDVEKKKAFLKAREQMRIVPRATPPPQPEATPRPRLQPAPSLVTPKPPPQPETTPAPAATPKPSTAPEPTPRPRVAPQPTPRPKPKARATPLLVITPKPAPVTPPPRTARELQAPVTVQKSTFEDAEIVPAEKEHGGGWFGTKYKYLTRATRSEIDKAPVRRNRWRYIVVHNSGTRQGSAKAFNYYHLRVRKMPNGMAYHFVIGNGSSTGDGQIEIGTRWTRQVNGGHVHSDYLNNIALGICLVGDYNRDKPTARQLEALDELVRYLRKRVGKVEGRISIVKAHREINPPRWPTDCPGDKFPYSWLHGKFD
jgi:outer membrane biosynthesis protein TonB